MLGLKYQSFIILYIIPMLQISRFLHFEYWPQYSIQFETVSKDHFISIQKDRLTNISIPLIIIPTSFIKLSLKWCKCNPICFSIVIWFIELLFAILHHDWIAFRSLSPCATKKKHVCETWRNTTVFFFIVWRI